jgi:hypothetical protein
MAELNQTEFELFLATFQVVSHAFSNARNSI